MPILFDFDASLPATIAGAAALRDKKLDSITGDLAMTTDLDQIYTSNIAGIAADLKAHWLFVKGDWFLDLEKGVDYWGIVFAKGATIESMEQEFRREALATLGVSAIALRLTKRTGRVLDLQSTVTTDTGLIFTASLAVNAGS